MEGVDLLRVKSISIENRVSGISTKSCITIYDDTGGEAKLCYPDIRKLIIEKPKKVQTLKLREGVNVVFDGVKRCDIEGTTIKCPPEAEISWD